MSGDLAGRAAQLLAQGLFGEDLKVLAEETEASLADWEAQDLALYGADLQDDIGAALARAAQDEDLVRTDPTTIAPVLAAHCHAIAVFQGEYPPATVSDAVSSYAAQQAALAAAIRERRIAPEKDAELQAILLENIKLRLKLGERS